MNVNAKVGIGAIFKLVVRKADTDEIVRETPEFHNLVLTTGLARMAVNTWIDRCCVGTGSSEPVVSQVGLDSFLASTNTIAKGVSDTGGIQVTDAPFYWYGRRTWRFDVGVATGNISEVGLGWENSELWNRALIKDVDGHPTTMTVFADEYIDVISEIRVYPQESSGTFNLIDKLGNIISQHSFIAKPRFSQASGGADWVPRKVSYSRNSSTTSNPTFGLSTGSIPTIPTAALSTGFSTMGLIHTPLVNGLKASKVVSSSEGNIGNHKSFTSMIEGLMCGGLGNLSNSCGYNWEIDPAIPKDAETILTYSFTLTWGNYAPE